MTLSRLIKYTTALSLIGTFSGILYYQYSVRQGQQGLQEQTQECSSCTRRHTSMTRAMEAPKLTKQLLMKTVNSPEQ